MKNLIYEDEEYKIVKKDLEVCGSLVSGLEIMRIGLEMTSQSQEWEVFASKDDYILILDSFIKDIEKIKKKARKG